MSSDIKIRLIKRMENFATSEAAEQFRKQVSEAASKVLLRDDAIGLVFLGGEYRHVDHAMTMDCAIVNKYDFQINGVMMNLNAQLKSSEKTNIHLEVMPNDMGVLNKDEGVALRLNVKFAGFESDEDFQVKPKDITLTINAVQYSRVDGK